MACYLLLALGAFLLGNDHTLERTLCLQLLSTMAPRLWPTDEQGVADWQAEWGAYCSTTISSLQAWLQSDSDDMAIMQVQANLHKRHAQT